MHLDVILVMSVYGGRGPGEIPTGKLGYFSDLWRHCQVYYQCMENETKHT